MPISWLDNKPHAIAVYASWPALPSAHATLATGRPATALPGPVFHRLDRTSFRWRLRKSRLVMQTNHAGISCFGIDLDGRIVSTCGSTPFLAHGSFGTRKSATPAATLDSAQEVLDLCVEGERLFLAAAGDGRSRACRRRSASAVRGCRTWREGRAAVWRRPFRSARTMRRRRPSAGSAASISPRCASAVFGDEILIGLAYARRAPETAANVVVGDHRVTTRLGELQTKKTAVPWERPRCLGLGLELS
jgi:hypothetical protein